jgi:hypothetical protein
MKKRTLAAILAAPIVIAGTWTAAAASDNNSTDAATYASTHPVAAPTPAPTVTVTAPAKPAATVTTTVTVPQVPQSCLDALDSADLGFTYASQILNAAAQLDAETMNTITAKLTDLAPTYNTNKAACRAAGGN